MPDPAIEKILDAIELAIQAEVEGHYFYSMAARNTKDKKAKEVFEQSYHTGKSPAAVVEDLQLNAGGGAALIDICKQAVAENPKVVSDIKGGKLPALQVLVGHVMKHTRGGADPREARKLLMELLDVRPE